MQKVVSPRVVMRGELGVTQSADQRHAAAERPCAEHPCRRACHAGDQGRRLEDARSDDNADDNRDCFVQAKHRLRFAALHLVVGYEMQEVGLGGSDHRTAVRRLLLIIE